MSRAPGMRDVARAAGVSHQTVSRVLNEPERVRAETRERVQVAMSRLGYRRNLAARALVSGHTATIGVVWTGTDHFGPSKTVAGIEVAARNAGYATLVGAMSAGNEDDARVVLESLADRHAEAIAVVAPHERMLNLIEEYQPAIPTVLVGSVPETSSRPSVGVDQRLGARMVVEHLASAGARRIAHVSGPADWFDAQNRVVGWRETTAELGVQGPLVPGDWSAASGHAAALQLLDDLPDAIFCTNDLVAIGLMSALRDRGVLDQVRVVGYDDIDGIDYMSPSLTSVRQPLVRLGAKCMEAMVAAMQGVDPGHLRMPPELMVRQSSA